MATVIMQFTTRMAVLRSLVACPGIAIPSCCSHVYAKIGTAIFLERKLNKAELIEALVKETDVSKAAAGRTIDALVQIITKTVAKKEDVQLIGFGTFKATKRAARKGKNPRTGEPLKIAAATVPKFTAGAAFKAAVNKKK